MPQISPMSWILIVMLLLALLISIKSNMPAMTSKEIEKVKSLNKTKNIKW